MRVERQLPALPVLVACAAALLAAAPAPAGAEGTVSRLARSLGRASAATGEAKAAATTSSVSLGDARAALATVDAMLRYDPGIGDRVLGLRGGVPLFREWAGGDMKPATAWPLGQLFAAELDMAAFGGGMARADRLIAELERYRKGGAYAPTHASRRGPATHRFYDDNAWIGLDLLQAFRQTGDRRYVELARRIVPFLEGGIQPGGGILWEEGNERPTFNTCALAPAAQFFLGLREATGDARFLDLARRLEPTLNAVLRRPDALYDDHVAVADPAQRGEALWSYNQGAALGANLQFADATADPAEKARFLGLARKTADAAIAKAAADPGWLWKQPPAFNAILFRNLARFDAYSPLPRWRPLLDAYLARAKREARRAENGAFELGGIGRYEGEKATGITLIDQAAFVQMFALRAMSREQLRKIY